MTSPASGRAGTRARAARYARNFLIPRGLAAPATPANLARVESCGGRRPSGRAAADRAQETRAKLEAVSVKLERAVGEENKCTGRSRPRTSRRASGGRRRGDRRKLVLPEPIKTLGLHEVPLKLHPELSATLRVEVVKKSG
jgi:large subunit ribosomal protein L9